MDDKTRTELEAATFRRLVEHLRERTDVQNIDLMNLAGFCRNCLSKWYRAEAEDRGVALSDPESRQIVYGMPYDEWRAKYPEGSQRRPKGRLRRFAEALIPDCGAVIVGAAAGGRHRNGDEGDYGGFRGHRGRAAQITDRAH